MSLEQFCQKPVPTVSSGEPVLAAARAMRDQGASAVVAVEEGCPVGLLTSRDIVIRVLLEDRDPLRTLVRDVMSPKVIAIRNQDKLDELVRKIREAGVRRLPIVDADGVVVGLVTLDDLFNLFEGGV
jgi:CBS domain-containing protein